MRNVVVQPSTYGMDNRLLVESLETFGLKTTRGIAVVNDSVKDEELKRLDAAGVRGVRFNLAQGGGTTWAMVTPLRSGLRPWDGTCRLTPRPTTYSPTGRC